MNPARSPLHLRLYLVFCMLMALAPAVAPAAAAKNTVASPTAPDPATSPSISTAINDALARLPGRRDLGPDQRKQAEQLLRDALDDDQRASDETAKADAFRRAAELGREAGRTDSPAPPDQALAFAEWREKLPADANTEQLSDLLEQERGRLVAAQDAASAIENALQKSGERPEALREELSSARAEADTQPTQSPAPTPGLAEATALRAQAAQRLQRARLATLETEQRTLEPRLRGLFAQRSQLRRSVDEHAQRVHLLENMVLDRASSRVADLAASLTAQRDELVATKAPAPLPQVAGANLELGADLVATLQRVGSLRDLKNAYAAGRSEAELAEKSMQARIDLGAMSEEVGALLLAERRKLKPLVVLNRDLAALRAELAKTKLSLLDLRDQQDGLENSESAIARTLTQAGQLPVLTGDLHDRIRALLNTRADVLTRLISAKTTQVQLLNDAEQQVAALTDRTRTLFDLLDAHLLGTPSHAPVGMAWLGDLARSVRALYNPQALRAAFDFRRSGIVLPLLALLALLSALVLRSRVPTALERIAAPMRRIRSDRYRFTMQALVLTALAASPVALCWLIAGYILQRAARGDLVGSSLAIATTSMAGPWFMLALLYWLNRENGLAHLHFRWLRARRTVLRRAVPFITAAIVVPWFVHIALREMNNEDGDGTVGRALFIVATLGLAAIAWRVLRAGGAWSARSGDRSEPIRMRQIARVVFCALFAGLAFAAAAGYFFTAQTLAEHVVRSLCALLVIAIAEGLAVRWLTLGERRLLLKRAEERAIAERKARGDDAEGEATPEIELDEPDVADLGAQTRRVLRLAIWFVVGTSLLLIWADIAPALSFLDNIKVWKSTSLDETGKSIGTDVTLRSVLESVLILATTIMATQNLPGLLEIGILRRLHIDAATRYAITSVVRYLIILVGGLAGIALLGVHWSNLQWLAAGLTVGLGFGLQEIFANFISGLIVLFERPYRVGDIITIGNVEGTVTRIRTRATTMLDWDNREVFVPNKSFITERLTNWTLSDSTTRVAIKIGVAYRNDPRIVQALLLETASSHELVLKEPAPLAWMMNFGDSTLDFELRVFVAEINQRNIVRTELMMRIAEKFAANDIEIAFPQRDVWLRTPVQLDGGAERAAEPAQSAASAAAMSASKRD